MELQRPTTLYPVVRKQRKSDVEDHLHRYSYHLTEWLGQHVRGVVSDTRWVRIPIAIPL